MDLLESLAHLDLWDDLEENDQTKVAASEAVVRAVAAAAPALLRGGKGASALQSAASEGRERALAALLAAGLDPNSRAPWARVLPLHAACSRGHVSCVRLLLEHGADAKAQQNASQQSSLHFAAAVNSVECVELLLQHGVDISASDSMGRTPLCYAAETGAAESLRVLGARGADPNMTFSRQVTPLLLAAKGRTELHLPYHTSAPEPPADYRACVRELIRLGADPQVADEDGYNVLYYAIKNGSKDLFVYLTDGLIDVSSKSSKGETPLHWAALWAKTEFMRDLVRAGIDINSRRNDGKTPLHLAVDSYKKDCVGLQEILDLGADVHAQDNEGWTALHLACSNNVKEMIPVLLRAGADVASTTNAGETPLHVACWTAHAECATQLLDEGAAVDAAAADGKTAVHFAAQSWSTCCLEELVKRGADLSARDQQGWTALHCAADAGTGGKRAARSGGVRGAAAADWARLDVRNAQGRNGAALRRPAGRNEHVVRTVVAAGRGPGTRATAPGRTRAARAAAGPGRSRVAQLAAALGAAWTRARRPGTGTALHVRGQPRPAGWRALLEAGADRAAPRCPGPRPHRPRARPRHATSSFAAGRRRVGAVVGHVRL
ncbi:Transient receptor potential channel pyrexia [Gryllus bimaculatus]|nr:Transient receptor potential channel pyrexia [Gryllus bimaculatus]